MPPAAPDGDPAAAAATAGAAPAGPTSAPAASSLCAAAEGAAAAGAAARAAVGRARAAAARLVAAHAAAVGGDGSGVLGAADAGAGAAEAAARAAVADAGHALLAACAGVRAQVRAVAAGGCAVGGMLTPFRSAEEEGRLELQNLTYRREMLRRDVLAYRAYRPKRLDGMALVTAGELAAAAGGGGAAPMDTTTTEAANAAAAEAAAAAAAEAAPRTPTSRKGGRRKSHDTAHSPAAEAAASPEGKANSASGHMVRAVCENGGGGGGGSGGDGVAMSDLALAADETDADREHTSMLARLEYEVKERRRLASVVLSIRKDYAVRKARIARLKLHKAEMPRHMETLKAALKPIRDFLETDAAGSPVANPVSRPLPSEEVNLLRSLPAPLYVLAREAVGARDNFGGLVSVHVMHQDPDDPAAAPVPAAAATAAAASSAQAPASMQLLPNGAGAPSPRQEPADGSVEASAVNGADVCAPPDPEVDTPASLHKAHPQFVCVDLHDVDSGGRAAASSTKARRSPHKRTRGGPLHNGDAAAAAGQTLLSLTFRYHPSLNVVTVGCAHDDNLSRVTVDDLVVLYPFDYGVQSPNPANAFLLDGAFAFDRSRVPNNGRPFVWANMLCGLYYPGFIKGNVERHRSTIPESFLEWSEYARSFPTHLRFVEVLNAVRRRVASKRSLQEQFETLQTLQLPLTWRQVGLAEAPNATLKVFHVLPPEQNWAAYGISTMPSSEKNITACAFHVEHSGGVALVGMVGIQRDYPATKGLFRLKCHADSAWKVPEPVIRQLECDVNVFGHEDEAGPDGVDARSKGKDRRGSVSRSPVRAAPRAGSSGAGGAGASSVDAATMAHVNGRPGGPGAPVVPGAGEGRGSRAGGISDDMTLSMQMVKLLSCVDKLASDCARADAEEAPGANFHEDPMSWRGRGGGVDGGDDDVGDSPPERTTRKTRGRARSRKFAS